MISPPNSLAREIPNEDLPDAVGPSMTTSRGREVIETGYAKPRRPESPVRRGGQFAPGNDWAHEISSIDNYWLAASRGRLYRKMKRRRISGPLKADGK